MTKTDVCRGWTVRVGGPLPYLSWQIHYNKADAEKACTYEYHRPVKAVLVPLAEYRRLKRAEKTLRKKGKK